MSEISYNIDDNVFEIHWIGNEGIDSLFIDLSSGDAAICKGFKGGMYPSINFTIYDLIEKLKKDEE